MRYTVKAKTNKKEVDLELTIVSGVLKKINVLSMLTLGEYFEKVEIPGFITDKNGRQVNITSISNYLFKNKDSQVGTVWHPIKEMIINDSISHIEAYAFDSSKIEVLHWPKSCKVIEVHCFSDSYISQLVGIDDVTNIRESAFERCYNLTEINWPKNAKSVPPRCFLNCSSLKKVRGLEKVEHISEYAFYACRSLTSLSWPKACKKIPYRCFMGCSKLKTVRISSSINIIAEGAFEKTAIEKLDLSKSISCKIVDTTIAGMDNVKMPFYQ